MNGKPSGRACLARWESQSGRTKVSKGGARERVTEARGERSFRTP